MKKYLIITVLIFLLLKVFSYDKKEIIPIIEKYSIIYNLDKLLIESIIYTESRFNPNAKNGECRGLMQVQRSNFPYVEIKDFYIPDKNINMGCFILRECFDLAKNCKSEKYSTFELALIFYNQGYGNFWLKHRNIADETRNYLVKVKRYYNYIKNFYEYERIVNGN